MTAPTSFEKQAAIRDMHARHFTTRQISRTLSCSYQTIQRALDPDRVVSKFASKPMPDDFAARAPMLTFSEAACEFGISGNTAFKWANACGVKFKSGIRPVPDDFEARCRVTVKRELERHYQASYETIKRWVMKMPADARAEHNAAVKTAIGDGVRNRWAIVNAGKPPKAAKVKSTPGRGVTWGNAKAVPIPTAKADIVSMAMRHLMRDYVPVHRSETVAGKAAIGLFKVGRLTVTEAELMALAARKGFTVSEGFAG